jgi:hypothetical protein
MTTRALILVVCVGISPLLGSICQAAPPAGAAVILLELPLFRADWPERRSGKALLALPPVYTLLSTFAENAGQSIIVRYPGGDLGNDWALEFCEWLVAFGVPSGYMTLEPGSGGPDRLLILLEAVSKMVPTSSP